eukprot:CAMPEP_0183346368 /NCGR_PEP_ID=MMETSP0164_2-20130417/11517_1 /TAXON_ID=221442 /ORGANISM="Coccolithus pelagicus ssp braarudi, Strain PLY182g" /LENGTH=291 /DNA_ID=CAMNT_0025517637 /DNA_START=69 /DNA_END=944 /DNA_ORIENTATION=+
MFAGRYGRRHRLAGLALLTWHVVGISLLLIRISDCTCICYDLVLGLLGIAATVSAARDFETAHRRASNVASGTLEPSATVTHSEMLEHTFYQGLNLVQIVSLHLMEVPLLSAAVSARAALLLLATLPWAVRCQFPVNRFSDNYSKGQHPLALLPLLYRVKKYQYLLYKHALLHGLNVSLALSPGLELTTSPGWRLYWLCLNVAYVMEFFTQTLVKRGYMSQRVLLLLQALLMLGSSGAALFVLRNVYVIAPIASLALNLVHRHHELINTAVVFGCTLLWAQLGIGDVLRWS